MNSNTQDVPTCSHHTTPVEVAGNIAETVNEVQFVDSDMYGPDVALNDDDNEMCDEENLLGGSDDDDEYDAQAPVDPENAPIPPRVEIPFYDNIHMGGDFDISTRDVVPRNRIWSAENPELDRGMVFVDKKQLLYAVKLYHATNNREYKVVTSKRDLWVSACKHDCSWWLRASLSRKHGLFEIKQYRCPHHCLYPRMNRDHTNISSSYIASHILGQVAVSIKNKCLHIHTYLFVYSVHI